MGPDVIWFEWQQSDGRKCQPDSERRVLVAQDDGYVEAAVWTGSEFIYDWPPSYYTIPTPSVPRVRYWADIPEAPTEDGKSPF